MFVCNRMSSFVCTFLCVQGKQEVSKGCVGGTRRHPGVYVVENGRKPFCLPKGQRGRVTVRFAAHTVEKKIPLHPTFSASFGLSEAGEFNLNYLSDGDIVSTHARGKISYKPNDSCRIPNTGIWTLNCCKDIGHVELHSH